MKRTKIGKSILSLLIVFAISLSLLSAVDYNAAAQSGFTELDISSANWDKAADGTWSISDENDTVKFTGTTAYLTGVTYSKALDVTEEVQIDIQIPDLQLVPDSWLGITFGKDGNSFNDTAKGATYLLNYKTENNIECQGGTGWNSCALSEKNTFIFRKTVTGWQLLVKNGRTASSDIANENGE